MIENTTEIWKVAAGVIVILISLLYLVLYLFSHKPRAPFESELEYVTTKVGGGVSERKKLPQMIVPVMANPDTKEKRSDTAIKSNDDSDTSIDLSVVVPCYNETERLELMFKECIEHLNTSPWTYEIIVVDDGSKDGTLGYLLELLDKFELLPGQLRVVQFVKNRGKGGAVTHGMKFIRGRYGIFADADGASKFSDVEKLLLLIKKLETSKSLPAILIGSRLHMVNTDAVVKRTFIRNFLMYSLHLLVFVFGIRNIKDTQCGFKLFNRLLIRQIFPNMHTEGWIFDVEILILLARHQIPVLECPISWHEVDGSKMDLLRDSIDMAVDLVVTRLLYIVGIYRSSAVKQNIE